MPHKNKKNKPKTRRTITKSRKPKTRIQMAIDDLVVAFNNVDDSAGGKQLAKEITKAATFLGVLRDKVV